MRVEIDAQFGRALNHVLPIHSPRKRLVLHLPAHAGHFDLGDGFGGLDEGAGDEKAGQFVAGEQGLIEMRDAGHTGVLRVAQNGGAQLDGPAQALQFADAHKRVLFGRGVALIVEVVEQGGGGIKLEERGAFGTCLLYTSRCV